MLLALACAPDQGLTPEEKPGSFDSGTGPIGVDTDSGSTAPDEACNGLDDDGDGLIDEGYGDSDADGIADCVDTTCPELVLGEAGAVPVSDTCGAPPVADPWQVREKWAFWAPSSESPVFAPSPPTVGYLRDDNGDGAVGTGDRTYIVASMWHTGDFDHIVAIDAATGVEVWDHYPGGGGTGMEGLPIADIDGDGWPDVVTFDDMTAHDNELHPMALDGDGNVKWISDEATSVYAIATVADLDADGSVEVLVGDLILDGRTGSLLARLDTHVPEPGWTQEILVADLDLDGFQEILIGDRIFEHDGSLRWAFDLSDEADVNWVRVVQADADPEPELVWDNGKVWLTEADGTLIRTNDALTADHNPPPCVGDFDADGVTDIAVKTVTGVTLFDVGLNMKWGNTDIQESVVSQYGCSGADLDGDGRMEILQPSGASFAILDGATGEILWQGGGREDTNHARFPVVADVDLDGHAEVLTTNWRADDVGVITAWEHDGDGWAGAGPTWPLFHYTETNIDDNGHVPTSPTPWWMASGNERARTPSARPDAADLIVDITDVCTPDCTADLVEVAVQVRNVGRVDAQAGAALAVYDEEGTLLDSVVLPAVRGGEALAGQVFVLDRTDLGVGIVVRVDDAGLIVECDEDNNAVSSSGDDCYE